MSVLRFLGVFVVFFFLIYMSCARDFFIAMEEYFNIDSYTPVLQVVIGLVLYLCLSCDY